MTRPVRPRGPMSGARPRRKTNLICFDCTKGCPSASRPMVRASLLVHSSRTVHTATVQCAGCAREPGIWGVSRRLLCVCTPDRRRLCWETSRSRGHGIVCSTAFCAWRIAVHTCRRHCIGGWSFLEMALTSLRSAALHDGTDQGRRPKHQRDPGHRNLSSLNPQATMINASPGPCHPRRHRHPTFENVIFHVMKLPSDWPIACSANWAAAAPAKSYENFQLQTSPPRNPPALSHSHPQNRKSRHNGLPSHSPLPLHHRPPPSGCPEGRAQEGDQAQPRDSGAS